MTTLSLLLFFGCHPIHVAVDSDSGTGTPIVVDTQEGETADTTAPVETGPWDTSILDMDSAVTPEETGGVEEIPEAEDPIEALFSLARVHEVEITVSDDEWDTLNAGTWEFVEGDVVFDDIPLPSTGVRIKGRLGSYRDLSGKSGFKLDFNKYLPDQRLWGLKKLNLNNMVQDSAMTHEITGYAAFRAAGAPAPRVGYAWVRVNELDFGLYTVVEVYDDEFLEANYANPDGNLYDGDYHLWPDWSYTLIDFQREVDDYFVLDEGEDVGLADIFAITEAVAATGGKSTYYETLGTVIDWGAFFGMWAGEVWTGHYDSYSYNKNNYRVYFDPTDGLADFFPWDPDWAFYSSTPITSPSGVLAYYCMRDTACKADFMAFLPLAMERIDALGLVATVDEAADLIAPYIREDPRKEYSGRSVESSQEALRNWIETRTETVNRSFGL